jgi:hypothetical protein
VQALYSGGGGGNISSLVNLSSSDTNVIVATNGVLTGLTSGTATITVTFQTFTNTFQATVRGPGFTDNFGTSHNYLTDGVTNTTWDGVYAQPGQIPDTAYASDPAATNLTADANISFPNTLTVSNINVGWEFAQNDGFFLFKNVPGDFQVAVHITSFDVITYNNPGLLARAYSTDSHGIPGAPFNQGTNESWVSFTRFDEFGIGTYPRLTLANATTQSGLSGQPDLGDMNYWLLMVRQNGTNFAFYQRLNETDPWQPAPQGITYEVAQFAGVPMQVGIIACGFNNSVVVGTEFDSFMLDVSATLPRLQIASTSTNVVLGWSGSGWTLQSSGVLGSGASWNTVPGAPVVTNGLNFLSVPITNKAAFFRLIQ